jgi:3',5'-nucleoside bisphosphate phosphatase
MSQSQAEHLRANLEFRADLHCHTTCSDGTMSPKELVQLASRIGLRGLSITDHDSIAAYAVAVPVAKECGIELGTGVEFSSDFNGQSVHVLAYHFPLDSPQITAFCLRHQQRRKERNAAMLVKLRQKGFILQEDDLPSMGTVGRPHMALAMVKKGYVSSVKEAFQRYLGEGQSCYESGSQFSVAETLEIIHGAGAKAFLAHPHLFTHQRFVKKMLDMPFDGIECYYAKCHPDEEQRWLKIAKERGLLYSGGSDFHGDIKPQIPLGCSWVDEAAFRHIFLTK